MFLQFRPAWSIPSWSWAYLLALPVLSLLVQGLTPEDEIFSHLRQTVLTDYLFNSLSILSLTLMFAFCFGVPSAWLIAVCNFPGRSWFRILLVLPLAIPGYIAAYIYTDFLDYTGPVQRFLRHVFDWQHASDYWFFDVRSVTGASLMLALVLYPYVYLIVKNSFQTQEANLINAARTLGATPWQSFWKVALPQARPAIVVSLTLVAMETLADFAVAHYFAVPTLTTAVYETWLDHGSMAAASKLSILMLLGIVSLVWLEKKARRADHSRTSGKTSKVLAYQLTGSKAIVATAFCSLLLLLAAGIPLWSLVTLSLDYFDSQSDQLLPSLFNSLTTATLAALIATLFALLLNYNRRLHYSKIQKWPLALSNMGYAIPGTVLAIGILIPFTGLDRVINMVWQDWTGERLGLLLTGTTTALIFAFVIRFFAIASGAIESGFNDIVSSIDKSARTLGAEPLKVLLNIHRHLLKRPLFTAFLLVFVESMKELPAALLLRPFNFDTLATHVYQYVSDEMLESASLAALLIVLLGMLPVILLSREKTS